MKLSQMLEKEFPKDDFFEMFWGGPVGDGLSKGMENVALDVPRLDQFRLGN